MFILIYIDLHIYINMNVLWYHNVATLEAVRLCPEGYFCPSHTSK